MERGRSGADKDAYLYRQWILVMTLAMALVLAAIYSEAALTTHGKSGAIRTADYWRR